MSSTCCYGFISQGRGGRVFSLTSFFGPQSNRPLPPSTFLFPPCHTYANSVGCGGEGRMDHGRVGAAGPVAQLVLTDMDLLTVSLLP